MDLCACRGEADDPAKNLPRVLIMTTSMIVKVGGNNSPTL